MKSIQEIWNEIESCSAANHEQSRWRDGATAQLILDTQEKIKTHFPNELIEGLRIHDGSDGCDVYFFSGELLPCNAIIVK